MSNESGNVKTSWTKDELVELIEQVHGGKGEQDYCMAIDLKKDHETSICRLCEHSSAVKLCHTRGIIWPSDEDCSQFTKSTDDHVVEPNKKVELPCESCELFRTVCSSSTDWPDVCDAFQPKGQAHRIAGLGAAMKARQEWEIACVCKDNNGVVYERRFVRRGYIPQLDTEPIHDSKWAALEDSVQKQFAFAIDSNKNSDRYLHGVAAVCTNVLQKMYELNGTS